jgi:lysozyme
MKNLIDLLVKHEGIRNKPYEDSVGVLTIGVGRNLDDVGLSHDEIYYLLKNDIRRCEKELDNSFPMV